MVRRRNRMLRLSVIMLALFASVSWFGIPSSFTGTAYAAGFIDFENGSDRTPIKSTIPGLQFTTTDGQDWIYGDWRSGTYNGPYPRGSYFSDGNFFAWLGENQGDGRIDFTEGNASFLSADVSTPGGVIMRGYDAANAVIAESTFSGSNVNTGRLDSLGIEAPNGKSFSYVIISGTANYWLIDNLSTDAKGVPGNPDPRPERPRREPDPANIVVVERPNPNMVASRSSVDFGLMADAPASAANDGIVDYVVSIVNHGSGGAKDAIVTMPYNPATQNILDATFSVGGAYVSQLITSTTPLLEFHTGPIAANSTITATLRLLVRPGAADGANLSQRLSYSWTDGRSGGTGTSNLPMLVAGAADSSAAYYPLVLADDVSTISATVFVPGESVALWYNTPAGSAVAIATVTADANGAIAVPFDTSGLSVGSYTIVAQGAWSNFTAVAPFSVTP